MVENRKSNAKEENPPAEPGAERPDLPEQPIDPIVAPFERFAATEASSGVALLLAAGLALVLANSPFAADYDRWFGASVGLTLGESRIVYPLRHWINDGLLTLFFFVVGLKIKRELVSGDLSRPGQAVLPLFAALGGMAAPAAIYLLVVGEPQAVAGWGIVTATDIAFVVGALGLLGSRVPASLRVLVLALAILDDIGAVVVVALGYSEGIEPARLFQACGGLAVIGLMRWLGIRSPLPFWAAGIATWAVVHESGIHPTLTGVAIAMIVPVAPAVSRGRLKQFIDWATDRIETGNAGDEAPAEVAVELEKATKDSIPPVRRLEMNLHAWSAFVVLPLFALANAGVDLTGSLPTDRMSLAIVCGLLLGKPLGIVAFAWLATRTGVAALPRDITWPMLAGAGCLAGIGFTMSIFISGLAFEAEALDRAKLAVLVASALSGLVGYTWLRIAVRARSGEGA